MPSSKLRRSLNLAARVVTRVAGDTSFTTADSNSRELRLLLKHANRLQVASELRHEKGPLVWFLAPTGPGSGGVTTISRFIRSWREGGVRQAICVTHPSRTVMLQQRDLLRSQYQIPGDVPITNSVGVGSAGIATSWQSCFAAKRVFPRHLRLIFLQDYEPDFHAAGFMRETARMAMSDFGFALTAGPWLMTKTEELRISQAAFFDFGVDDIYTLPPVPSPQKRVIAYFQPGKPWRMPELVLLSAREYLTRYPDSNVQFLLVGGGPKGRIDLGGRHFAHGLGVVPPADLAALYRLATVGLCFSATNASLVPREMASSGLSVVINEGSHSEWVMARDLDICAVPESPESVARAVHERLLRDRFMLETDPHVNPVRMDTCWSDQTTSSLTVVRGWLPHIGTD